MSDCFVFVLKMAEILRLKIVTTHSTQTRDCIFLVIILWIYPITNPDLFPLIFI